MDKSRLHELDIMKGIGIILVVLGHSRFVSDALLTWMTSFHMPLFFVISGLQRGQKWSCVGGRNSSFGGSEKSFGKYALGRFCRIMLPYIWFSLIYIGIDYIYYVTHPELMSLADIHTAVLQGVSLFGISVLWFLPTLFLAELVLYGMRKLVARRWNKGTDVVVGKGGDSGKRNAYGKYITFVLGMLLSAGIGYLIELASRGMQLEALFGGNDLYTWSYYCVLGIGRVFLAICCMLAGVLIYQFVSGLTKRQRCDGATPQKKALWIACELGAGVLLLVLGGVLAFCNPRVDVHFLYIGNPFIFYASAIASAAGLYLVCRQLARIQVRGIAQFFALIRFLGRNSLVIMLTHLDCQVMALCIWAADVANRHLPFTSDVMFHVYLYVGLLVCEVACIFIVNKLLFWLLGKRKPIQG